MSSLPKGWKNVSIDDITSDVSYGVTAKSDPFEGDLQLLRITDIQNNKVDWSSVPYCKYEPKYESSRLKNNDIVVARTGATVGKSFLIENAVEDSVYASYLIRLRVAEGTLPKYLATFLHTPSYWQQISEQKAGIGQPNVNGTKLKTLKMPLAPLAEQKRIVEKLDEVLAQVDTIKARLDGIPSLLKRFRQSVLASAVSGKLTEEWRGVTDSYKTVIVNDICDMAFDGPFGSKLKSNDYTQIGCRVVRLENIGHLHFLESKKTYVSESKFDSLPKNHLAEGDILFSSFVDEEIRVCLFPGLETGTINKADCFCLRVNSEIALNKYVCYLLASLPTYLKIKKAVHGATRPRINLRFLKNFELELPDLAEQKEIVRLVDQYFAFADTIEAQVKKAQARVNNLTQSILAKAFRGELVPQDPNDESADKLLERIAQARIEAETLANAAKKAETARKKAQKV